MQQQIGFTAETNTATGGDLLIGATSIEGKTSQKFEGSYWQWIKDELSGWESFAWGLYGFGMGLNTMSFVTQPITLLGVIAYIAIAFGFLCTVAMAAKGWKKFVDTDGITKKKLVTGRSINGVLGAISVIGYVIVNASVGHWWSVLDQLVFFFAIDLSMMIHWRTWGRGTEGEKIKNPTIKQWVLIVAAILVGWAILYPIGIQLHDSQPLTDALVLAIGGTASVLYVKRFTGTYVLWIASNLVNVVLWAQAFLSGKDASLAMLIMTALYMVSSIYGKVNFRAKNNGLVKEL